MDNGAGTTTVDLSVKKQEEASSTVQSRWSPSGSWWRDLLYFVGPGWLVCIAYVDPGNYQADIQAGATAKYKLLWTIFWTSVLSIYVQVLCVRLAVYGQTTLAEVQAKHCSRRMRYVNWAIAEFSTIITDLPEVIGVGIACRIFFGWPYWVGVICSLFTTMLFLATMSCGIRVLEGIIVVFVGVMSVALWSEMTVIGYDAKELLEGWVSGFVDVTKDDIFSITGILGAVVMPHNLYLHTASCQSRRVVREEDVVRYAVRLSSWEAVVPILTSFFINMAVVSVAAESVYGQDHAASVGLTDFCDYFKSVKSGCLLFGVALLAAGQSSAITTTYTGQYVMDGFLKLRLSTAARAVLTRLVAITPCVVVSAVFPNDLNHMINSVNSALALLLPFAFTPLVMYNTSETFMGRFAPPPWERRFLRTVAFAVYLLNAVALAVPGGGMFGFVFEDLRGRNWIWFAVLVVLEVLYLTWQVVTIFFTTISPMRPFNEERPDEGEFATASSIFDNTRPAPPTTTKDPNLDESGNLIFSYDDDVELT